MKKLLLFVLLTLSVHLAIAETATVTQNEQNFGDLTITLESIDRGSDAALITIQGDQVGYKTFRITRASAERYGYTWTLISIDRDEESVIVQFDPMIDGQIVAVQSPVGMIRDQEQKLAVNIQNDAPINTNLTIVVNYPPSILSDDTQRTVSVKAGEQKTSYLRFTPKKEGTFSVIVELRQGKRLLDAQEIQLPAVIAPKPAITCELRPASDVPGRENIVVLVCNNPFITQQMIRATIDANIDTQTKTITLAPQRTTTTDFSVILPLQQTDVELTVTNTRDEVIYQSSTTFFADQATAPQETQEQIVTQDISVKNQEENTLVETPAAEKHTFTNVLFLVAGILIAIALALTIALAVKMKR